MTESVCKGPEVAILHCIIYPHNSNWLKPLSTVLKVAILIDNHIQFLYKKKLIVETELIFDSHSYN